MKNPEKSRFLQKTGVFRLKKRNRNFTNVSTQTSFKWQFLAVSPNTFEAVQDSQMPFALGYFASLIFKTWQFHSETTLSPIWLQFNVIFQSSNENELKGQIFLAWTCFKVHVGKFSPHPKKNVRKQQNW